MPTKEYSNGEITVVWKSDLCIHSGNCVRGLGTVFNTKNRPWINTNGATSEEIVKTVQNCPSGALSIKRSEKMNEKTDELKSQNRVQVFKGGPYQVDGPCVIVDKEGNEIVKEGKIFLCRCGASSNKPFCDGTHKKVEFDK